MAQLLHLWERRVNRGHELEDHVQGDHTASQGSKAGDQVSSGRHGRQQEILHGGRGLNVKIRMGVRGSEAGGGRWSQGTSSPAELAGQALTGKQFRQAGNVLGGHIIKGLECLAGELVLVSMGSGGDGVGSGLIPSGMGPQGHWQSTVSHQDTRDRDTRVYSRG